MRTIICVVLLAMVLGYGLASGQSAPTAGIAEPADCTRPEVMAFTLMQRIKTAPSGSGSVDLRQQLEQWRASAHERQRMDSLRRWSQPKEFVRHRQLFDGYMKEAQELFRKIKTSSNGPARTPTPAELKSLQGPAFAKLRAAANAWEDPLLKTFLMGVVEYQAGNAVKAHDFFREAWTKCPWVAAFAQGDAMALMDMDRPSDALAAALEVLRLRPDSPDALALVQKAMQKVPGTETSSATFTAAKEAVKLYEIPPATANPSLATTQTINWLMPGKPWSSRDDTLPVSSTTIDRLDFRQAVAVPLTENTLLVDGSLLGDALEVLVRVGEKKYAPGFVKKVSSTGKALLPPLGLVVVPGYTFKPVDRDDTLMPPSSRPATLYGLGMYCEMGMVPREIPARVQGGNVEDMQLSGKLAAGDSAGPILLGENLLGFLTGPTDVTAEAGGGQKFISVSQIAPLAKAAKTGSISTGGSYSKAKRTIVTQSVPGRVIIVYAISGERFTDK